MTEIFESFVQDPDEQHHGTGLGLAICKRLVSLMGGEIKVERRIQDGSVFSFSVHLQVNRTERIDQASRGQEDSPLAVHVLLVEDNRINRELAAVTLRRRGLVVDTAEDGQKALERLAQRSYHVVLMDLRMPNMDGLEAIRHIRDNPALTTIPVIAISAGVLDGESEQALASGFDEFLGKPIDYPLLLQTISRLTRRSSAPDTRILNLGQALNHHQDAPDFLFKLLRECIDLYGHAHESLIQHIAEGDSQAAEHLLHNIASVAGGFGGDRLMQTGRDMERQLRADPAALNTLDTDLFTETLTQFMAAIQTELDSHPSKAMHDQSLAD